LAASRSGSFGTIVTSGRTALDGRPLVATLAEARPVPVHASRTDRPAGGFVMHCADKLDDICLA